MSKRILKMCLGDMADDQCRYLGEEDGHYFCLKLNPVFRDQIDSAVVEYLSNPLNPTDVVPLGDNCPGVDPEQKIAPTGGELLLGQS